MRTINDFTAKTVLRKIGMELRIVEDFDLSQIPNTFKIVDFERRLANAQVSKIMGAIMENRLYDNIITVMKPAPGTKHYEVIDGQHRLTALSYLQNMGKLSKYTLVIRILTNEDARMAYRMINSGSPLTSFDIMKSFDDGHVPFFNELRDYCAHYRTPIKPAYAMVAYAFLYATGKTGFLKRDAVIDSAIKMSVDDVHCLQRFFVVLTKTIGTDTKNHCYRVPVFWNLLKLFVTNDKKGTATTAATFPALLKWALKDEKLIELSGAGKNRETIQEMYATFEGVWKTLVPPPQKIDVRNKVRQAA